MIDLTPHHVLESISTNISAGEFRAQGGQLRRFKQNTIPPLTLPCGYVQGKPRFPVKYLDRSCALPFGWWTDRTATKQGVGAKAHSHARDHEEHTMEDIPWGTYRGGHTVGNIPWGTYQGGHTIRDIP